MLPFYDTLDISRPQPVWKPPSLSGGCVISSSLFPEEYLFYCQYVRIWVDNDLMTLTLSPLPNVLSLHWIWGSWNNTPWRGSPVKSLTLLSVKVILTFGTFSFSSWQYSPEHVSTNSQVLLSSTPGIYICPDVAFVGLSLDSCKYAELLILKMRKA